MIEYKKKIKRTRSKEEREESKRWLALRELSEQDWIDKVDALPEEIRPTIARAVWWDFWSPRLVSKRWKGFDKYLFFDNKEETDPIPTELIARYLSQVGYPDYRIKFRLMAF